MYAGRCVYGRAWPWPKSHAKAYPPPPTKARRFALCELLVVGRTVKVPFRNDRPASSPAYYVRAHVSSPREIVSFASPTRVFLSTKRKSRISLVIRRFFSQKKKKILRLRVEVWVLVWGATACTRENIFMRKRKTLSSTNIFHLVLLRLRLHPTQTESTVRVFQPSPLPIHNRNSIYSACPHIFSDDLRTFFFGFPISYDSSLYLSGRPVVISSLRTFKPSRNIFSLVHPAMSVHS